MNQYNDASLRSFLQELVLGKAQTYANVIRGEVKGYVAELGQALYLHNLVILSRLNEIESRLIDDDETYDGGLGI